MFFRYLSRHPELLEDVDERFFARESIRAWVGIVCYIAAGVLGWRSFLFYPSSMA